MGMTASKETECHEADDDAFELGARVMAQIKTRIDELRAIVAKDFAEGEEKLAWLSRAAGCPNGVPIIPWLVDAGLVIKTAKGFVLTLKGAQLGFVEP